MSLRGILSRIMYHDRVTVKRYKRKSGGGFTTQAVYEDVPCKLSQYGKDLLADKTQSTVNVTADLRLCLSPVYIIETNDVMEITHAGKTFTLYAGTPFVYPTHQEISVRRQKEGA